MPTSSQLPARSALDFESLATALTVLAQALPPRTTVRQALFYTLVAYSTAMGRTPTLTDIIAAAGDSHEPDDDGKIGPLLGRSIEKSSAIFMEPHKRNPEGLGWIDQLTDEDDRRRKMLRLSPKGVEAAASIVEAMRAH